MANSKPTKSNSILKPCSFKGCFTLSNLLRRGLCTKHYIRLWRHGDPSIKLPKFRPPRRYGPPKPKKKQAPITPERASYWAAKARCQCPTHHAYDLYGGRGIEFRFKSFQEFVEHLGPRPSLKHTLDRIDSNGHYEPGNVRWATWKQQGANKRSNRYITFQGRTQTVSDWARELGFANNTINERIKRGWCVSCSLTIPKQKKAGYGCKH